MKTALLGPVVPIAECADEWAFTLITGDPAADAKADEVCATDPDLLETMRGMLRRRLSDHPDVDRVCDYGDEMDLARAAAALWPARFASMVAFGEVYLAGGGQA